MSDAARFAEIKEEATKATQTESARCMWDRGRIEPEEVVALCDEIEHLRSVVTLARMLIQPGDDRPELVGHNRFLDALLHAVRGLKWTDPRDKEIDHLTAELASQTELADSYRCDSVARDVKQAEDETTIAAIEETIRSRDAQIGKLEAELALEHAKGNP